MTYYKYLLVAVHYEFKSLFVIPCLAEYNRLTLTLLGHNSGLSTWVKSDSQTSTGSILFRYTISWSNFYIINHNIFYAISSVVLFNFVHKYIITWYTGSTEGTTIISLCAGNSFWLSAFIGLSILVAITLAIATRSTWCIWCDRRCRCTMIKTARYRQFTQNSIVSKGGGPGSVLFRLGITHMV